ncbi:MAG TPA: hypothetical protein VGC78_08700 [Gaiellaceae bacterium]|jgi:plastocyanin
MKKTIGVILALSCAGVAAAVAVARPASSGGTLQGSVGPGYAISLTQNGTKVTHLDPGTYTIDVDDKADSHNFHLFGAGVDQSTDVDTTGTATWTVTLQDGATYTYVCDAHPATMIGRFTVGNVPVTTTTVTTPSPPPLAVKATATVAGRVVTVKAHATRTASFDIALLRGTTRVAHVTRRGTTVTARLTARKAGRYTARVVAKAGTAAKTVRKTVTVK